MNLGCCLQGCNTPTVTVNTLNMSVSVIVLRHSTNLCILFKSLFSPLQLWGVFPLIETWEFGGLRSILALHALFWGCSWDLLQPLFHPRRRQSPLGPSSPLPSAPGAAPASHHPASYPAVTWNCCLTVEASWVQRTHCHVHPAGSSHQMTGTAAPVPVHTVANLHQGLKCGASICRYIYRLYVTVYAQLHRHNIIPFQNQLYWTECTPTLSQL